MALSVQRNFGFGALPFIGRETELAALADLFHDSYNGSRTVAWIIGEMGSGKSRLLEEFLSEERSSRAFIVRWRVHRDDEPGDLQGLRRALADALDSRPALRRQIESALNLSFGTQGGDLPPGRVLDLLARRVPLVLVVDDFGASTRSGPSRGESGATSLGLALRDVEGPFLMIASTTPSTASDRETVVRLCEAEPTELLLEPLDSAVLSTQVERLFGIRPLPEDLHWLVDATHGLPALLREALNALVQSGCIVARDEGWVRVHPFDRCRFTPLDALPLLRNRLAELSGAERSALTSAALLGRRIPHEAAALIGLPDGWHLPFVAREMLSAGDRYVEFAHDLLYDAAFAEAIREGLPAGLTDALVRLVPGAEGEVRDVVLPEGTLDAMLKNVLPSKRREILSSFFSAVSILVDRGEYHAALVFFHRCRRYWDEIEPLFERVTIMSWVEMCSNLLYRVGRVPEQQALIDEFLGDFDAGETPATGIVPHVVDLLVDRIEHLAREKRSDEALEQIERAWALTERIGSESARRLDELVLTYERAEVYRYADRHAESAAILEEIVERSDPGVFSGTVFDALTALAARPRGKERDAIILHRLRSMLTLCQREGRTRAVIQLRAYLADSMALDGEYEQAEPLLRSIVRETRQQVLPRTESNAWYWLSVIQAERGDFIEALRLLEHSIEIRRRVRSIALWQVAMITKAQYLVAIEKDSEAAAVLEEIRRDARDNRRTYRRFVVECCSSVIAIRAGRWGDTRESLAALREIGIAEDYHGIESMLLEVEGEWLLRSPDVRPEEIRSYAERALAFVPSDISGHFNILVAAAAVGRLAAAGSSKRRSATGSDNAIRERVMETFEMWKRRGMSHNIARALRLLRSFASSLFSYDDLAPYADLVAVLDGPLPSHQYEIVTFGRLRVLDPTGAEQGGRHFGTHKSDSKPRKALAALASAQVMGRGVSREKLVDMVWGDGIGADTATNNFHVTLSGLRRVVGEGIDFDGAVYALNPTALRLDAMEFLRLIEEAGRADSQGRIYRAYDLLASACDLYRGEFLEGIYDDWSDAPRDLLRAKGRAALLRLAEIALGRGEHNVARSCVRKLMEIDVGDEEAMCLHLSILAAEGERVRALREYERFASVLEREYGVAPSRRLRELKEKMLHG